MEIRQLKYFLRIAEFGNITRASEALHIAQPALSQQIRNLEQELDVQLFHRFSNGVRPTEAGDILRTQAKKILSQIEETCSMVRSERDMPTGEVALGLPSSTARMIAIPLLGALLSVHPGIKIKFIEAPSSDLGKLLTRGDADLIVAVDPSPTNAFISIPLGTELLFVIRLPADVDSKTKNRMTIADLSKIPLMLMPMPNSIRVGLDIAFRRASLTYRLVSEITSTTVSVKAVRAGMGTTVLPWSAVGDEVESGQLTATPLSGRDLVRKLFLCRLSRTDDNGAVNAVQMMIVNVIDQLISDGTWKGMRQAKRTSARL